MTEGYTEIAGWGEISTAHLQSFKKVDDLLKADIMGHIENRDELLTKAWLEANPKKKFSNDNSEKE